MCAVRTFGWGGLEKKKELARKVSGSEKWKIHVSIAGGGAFISSTVLHAAPSCMLAQKLINVGEKSCHG